MVHTVWFVGFIGFLFLWAIPLGAQETIDPRSGRLVLIATDLMVPAGPAPLEVQRSLGVAPNKRGLLGNRWRLNWESRLVRAGRRVLLDEAGGTVPFEPAKRGGDYQAASGERLVFDKQQRALRTTLDGIKERFDAQGRLVGREYRNGNTVALHYGAAGRLAQINGPKGSFLRFITDTEGRVIRIDTSTGATVQYTYVGEALTAVQVNGGPVRHYTYDAQGALVRIDDSGSGAVELTYDSKGRVVSRGWADGSQERFEYDDTANRQRHIDAGGGITTTQWSRDRRQVEITDPLGHKSVIAFDAAGRPLAVTGPTGAIALLTYDGLGRTVAVEDPLRQVTRFAYLGESWQVQTIRRPDGTRQTFAYDGQGNLTTVTLGETIVAAFTYHPDGSVATAQEHGAPQQRFTYHADGRLQSVANALGETTHFEYDSRGNLSRETNPLGGVTRRRYDAQDRLVSLTDPAGATSRYEYDAGGRLSRMVEPAGGETRYEYDVRGRLQAETDPMGQVKRYEYDAAGRLVQATGPGPAMESFRYDAVGNPTTWTNRLGQTTQFAYDPLGQLARERSPTGLDIRYHHDGLGRLVGREDASGLKGRLQRDAEGRLTAVIDPLGAVTQYLYDPLGNLLTVTDARGQVKRFTYGTDGMLSRLEEPSGNAAQYEYDAAGRVVTIQHPGGGVTRLTYDAMSNLLSHTDPLGNQVSHRYDLAGRLVGSTDAAGRVTRYLYDPSGRVTEKQLPDGQRVTYQYDQLGNLLQADDGVFPVSFSYDPAGRLLRVAYPAIQQAMGYEYDALGLRTKLIDSAGRETRYEYNTLKHLSAIILPDGKRIGLSYDVQERLQSIHYPNGIMGRWEYDATGRIEKLSYQDQHGKVVAGWTYRFDPAGNPIEWQESQDRSTRFQYDLTGQLTEETGPDGTIRYRYLPGGNRDALEAGGAVLQYRYDVADRLLQAGQEQLSYDVDGYLIERQGPKGTTVYGYDTEGQLTKVVGPDGATTTFGYAPTGERVWKRDKDGLTYYLYDGFDLIQEVGETGKAKAIYVHGPGIDRPLAMLLDGRNYYYHADRLGSIRLLTDDRGQVAAAYQYDAFGNPREQRGSVPNPFTFTGREWDASTGLYYFRARYYDAGLGRFLAIDPQPGRLDEPLTLNPYLYARNNPTRFIDPLGLSANDTNQLILGLWQLEKEIGELVWSLRLHLAVDTTGPAGWDAGTGLLGRLKQLAWKRAQILQLLRARGVPLDPPKITPIPPLGGADPIPPRTTPIPPRGGANPTPTVKTRILPPVPPQGSHPPLGQPPHPAPPGHRWVAVLKAAGWVWILTSVTSVVTSDDPSAAAAGMVPGVICSQIGGMIGAACGGPPGAIIGSVIGGLWAPTPGTGGRVPNVKPAPPPPPSPPRPPSPGSEGDYNLPKDPGMSDKPPDLAGAAQAGAQRPSTGRPPGGKGDKPQTGLGGTEVTTIPSPEPPPPPEPPPSLHPGLEPRPAPGGGWWCYSALTNEWYKSRMGPCPPPSWAPPHGSTPEDPAVRVPHDKLQPDPGMGDKPGGKPGKPMGPKPSPDKPMGPKPSPGPTDQAAGKPGKPMGPGPACGPMTSCTCKGGGKGHIPCDKAKGACHCGAG